MKRQLCQATPLLDFEHPSIQALIKHQGWRELPLYEQIGAVYHFVKDDIKFGYNKGDDIKASEVLHDGYGQCNTKSTLLMALLRALEIPCRFHGFTIDKALQKGALPLWAYTLAPQSIIHSWVEVLYQDQWLALEGIILDKHYLNAVIARFGQAQQPFCGYGIATECLSPEALTWQGKNTYIQSKGINQDLGIYDDPDGFYHEHGANLRGIKRWLYQNILRHGINAHVARLRQTKA